MKLSFSTLGCPDWSLDQIAKNAKAFGYTGVELRAHEDGNHFSPNASIKEAKRAGKLFRDAGAPVISLAGYSRFAFVDDNEVARNQALLIKLIAIAEAMGAKFIRTFAGQIPTQSNRDEMTERVAHAIKPLAELAAKKKITIGLETHDDWCSGDRVMRVVNIVKSRGFGVVYDIHNAFNSGIEPWDVTYRKVRKHICYCHVKDAYTGADGKPQYVLLGAGQLPIQKIVNTFRRGGYKGFFSFEWEKKWHAQLENPERAFPQFPIKMKNLWNHK